MNSKLSWTQRERGQAVVLVALMALALVAFAGLALDGAQVYQMRRRMQNAADAGAYAGAYALTASTNHLVIDSKVSTYTVGGNGIGNGADSYEGVFLPSGNNVKTTDAAANDICVRVTTTVAFPTIMIGMIGFDSLPASARATACSGPPSGGTELWPLVIHTPTVPITYGTVMTLFNDGTTGNGTFGWADFNGPANGCGNQCDVETWLANPYTGTFAVTDWSNALNTCGSVYRTPQPIVIAIGDCLDGSTGLAISNQIETEITNSVGLSRTVLLFDKDTPKGGGNYRFRIAGLGRFTVVGFCLKGTGQCPSGKLIKGYFQKWLKPSDICIPTPANPVCAGNFGVTGITLGP